MAELVLSAFLGVLFEKLSSAAVNKIAGHKGIDADIKKWQRSLTQIQGVLADASQKEITNQSVKRWLNDLQHLAYDIDDVLDDLAYEAMDREFKRESEAIITSKVRKLVPSCCSNFSRSSYKMHDKLENISIKLPDLVKEKTYLGLRVEEDQTRPRNNNNNYNNNRRFESCVFDPSSIVGRQAEKEELVRQLLEDDGPSHQNFSVVPIVGMGGVGKTTLAKLLYAEKQVNDRFELKAWVCVSDVFDIFGISKAIFKAVAPEVKEEFTDFNLLHVALTNHLRGKRFLLVLDDVWSEDYDDWKRLVEPFYGCNTGSKIIITTRTYELVKKLVSGPLNKQLERLSNKDALSLLALNALDANNFDSHLLLKPYAEVIVKKCGSLPLALIVLGRSLRTKREEVESWKEVSNSEIWSLKDGDRILPALRLSYHDLSAPLKQLFSYCTLFPKDFLFDKDELVLLWMAEGFLHQSTPSHSTEEHLGNEYFDELLSRSLFQHAPNSESLFVMHDLLNDLATYVAGEFFVRLNNETKKNIREEMLEKYRHISFVREEFVPYMKFETLTRTKCLRTFLATSVGVVDMWQCFYLSSKVLVDLLQESPLLRVLHLSNFIIREVPESIGNLRHLRYLNLSKTSITQLPENVCNLYNLETLIVFGCYNLTKLPSFLKLKKLRHLDIRDTQLLKQMPLRIGELENLQTLSKIIIEGESGFDLTELKKLENICGKVSILGLDKVENATHACQAKLSQKRFSELELVWGDELHGSRNEMLEKDVLNELKPCNESLKQLKIMSYMGLEFPKWIGDPLFHHLKHVSISGCKRCTTLPSLGQLSSLRELFIEGLDKLGVVGLELLGTSGAFPSLEILSFKDMSGWKKWLANTTKVFPCLKQLHIKNCPILVEVTLEGLPLLKDLYINGCPSLVEVSLGVLTSLNVLDIRECDSGVLRKVVEVASTVTKLSIKHILGLNDVVWRDVIKHLKAVEELSISYCNEIRYVWESEVAASKVLVKLRKLEVWHCDNLVSLGEREDEDNCRSNLLTTLKALYVSTCKNMKHCNCPDSIETLSVWSCDSVTDISLPISGQKLKSLTIYGCKELLEREWGGQKMNNNRSSNMSMLESVSISFWLNLKSIVNLNFLVRLTSLRLTNCENLESFPDKELPDLTSLKELEIKDCRGMDGCFPRGYWPPNLRSLIIGRLKKPISEWGPQNFPNSLVELWLLGGGEDGEMSNCSQLSHLLPSSLTSLHISSFEKLESFSIGLQHLQRLSFDNCPNLKKLFHPQHLTSLQHLIFWECPSMTDLPEVIFPSLLSLTIWSNCQELKERCSERGGTYWHLISHIPHIYIQQDSE